MPDREIYLKIDNLVKKFGDFTALCGVSFDIFNGEFVCFLGPSGCGKTTLLRAIAGLDIQTSGRVEQAGSDISALPPSERDFGIVFQSYALFPNLNVIKNISYGLENLKKSRADINTRVSELLNLVGLGDHGAKYPAQLSGGEQQRVALARAMAMSPGLLLLDEPLSALDARVRVHLRHEIMEIQRKLGVTTIMVTHDQEEALTMADRIVVMNNGLIEQIGTPEEIYSSPASAFVADFIGTMNFIPGKVNRSGAVTIGDVTFNCQTGKFKDGDKVVLAIRPEDVNAQDINEGDDNIVEVDIRDLEFLGSYYRAELGGGPFAGSQFYADFSVNLLRRKDIKVGSKIAVRFPGKYIQLYAET